MPSRPVTDGDVGVKSLYEHETKQTTVDILAVHGIGAHPYDTWCQLRQDGLDPSDPANWINWLSDRNMLPGVLPTARIMRYGYRSAWFGKDMLKTNPRTVSKELLSSLKRERENCVDRPLILIAHSFGGLVVLQALLDAWEYQDEWGMIGRCVVGLVFFGTPFRGTNRQTLQQLVALAQQELGEDQVLETSIKTLEADDEYLNTLVERFQRNLSRMIKPKIACFWEQLPTNISRMVHKASTAQSVMWIDEQTATLDITDSSIEKFARARDHLGLNKYRDSSNEDFKQVSDVIQRFAAHGPTIIGERQRVIGQAPVVSNIPLPRNPDFVGRDDILEDIESSLTTPGYHNRLALVGLGGIGKTQIALEFCSQHQKRHPNKSILWVHAGSQGRFVQAYQEIARLYQIPGHMDPKADTLKLVYKWLMDPQHGDWLMVLDNADDDALLFDSAANHEVEQLALIQSLPRCNHGSILVTSRNKTGRKVAGEARTRTINQLDSWYARQLLIKKLPNARDDSSMSELVALLDRIPLAITQAAAYMSSMHCDASTYVSLFQQSEQEQRAFLSQEWFDELGEFEKATAVIKSWKVSLDQIKITSPYAMEILSLMSMYDNQSIPATLLHLDDNMDRKLVEAVGTLVDYALISAEVHKSSYSMHRLVQIALRAWLDAENLSLLSLEKATEILSVRFPLGEFETWQECGSLLPHAEKIINRRSSTAADAQMVKLLWRVGNYHKHQGRYSDAEAFLLQATNGCQTAGVVTDTESLSIASGLANIYRLRGKLDDSESLCRTTLATTERLFGADTVDSTHTLQCLAIIHHLQGRSTEAVVAFERVLAIRSRSLGEDDRETLASAMNLAIIYGQKGRLTEAERIYDRVLAKYRELLAADDLDILKTTMNLALIYRQQGRLVDAARSLSWTLEKYKKQLGEDHPESSRTAMNLGLVYQQQGRLGEAQHLYDAVLVSFKERLGEEHQDTLRATVNLAIVHRQQGRLTEAERLYNHVLPIFKAKHGDNHPETLTAAMNLASVNREQGRYAEAEAAMYRIIVALERLETPNPTTTLFALHNLAAVKQEQGEAAAALELCDMALQGRQREHGADHHLTLESTYLKALLLYDLGGAGGEAEELSRRAAEGLEARLGPLHPETLLAVHVRATVTAGPPRQNQRALELCERALRGRRDKLGPLHFDTLASLELKASILEAMGRRAEAREACAEALAGVGVGIGADHPLALRLRVLADRLEDADDLVAARMPGAWPV